MALFCVRGVSTRQLGGETCLINKSYEMSDKFFAIENPAQKAPLCPSRLANETCLLKGFIRIPN